MAHTNANDPTVEYNLVILTSQMEQDYVVNTVVTEHTPFWIGLYDPDSDEVWEWVDGSPLDTMGFVDWIAGAPDDFGGVSSIYTVGYQCYQIMLWHTIVMHPHLH